MPLAEWKTLFEMSDRYGFIIASDECYSEIYFGEDKPLGALQAAQQLGRDDFKNLVVFSSLSKRSNVPECDPVSLQATPKCWKNLRSIALIMAAQ